MRIPVLIAGAGQAGLAMSHQLTARAIDHVVLERGQVANSWRTERWDSLRLLTPNWMSRLSGQSPCQDDPDGFMTKDQTADFIERFGLSFGAPVQSGVDIERVTIHDQGFEVATNQGVWLCDALVVATGTASEPRIPDVASELPSRIRQLPALKYRNPSQIGNGAVMVVGASASGVQIADELRRAGRDVTVASGEHVRVPRTYRGHDIYWWLEAIGRLAERWDEMEDLNRARDLPSLQLVGSNERRNIDLGSLHDGGVTIVGKLLRVAGSKAQFSGGLTNLIANADLKQNRLLTRIDEHAEEFGLDAELPEPTRPDPIKLGPIPTELDLGRYETIIWATGHRPSFSWLDPRALDHRGRLSHDGGICRVPGLYALGLPFLRTRKSTLIDGVGADSAAIAARVHAHLDQRITV